ncbi:MAG: C40 family peptidase [Chitinophagaceae bacterium]
MAAYLLHIYVKKGRKFHILVLFFSTTLTLSACRNIEKEEYSYAGFETPSPTVAPPGDSIVTGNVKPEKLVAYAKTMIGTPYRYGSTDPSKGFDCSGFITHVFNHFDIKVPRSSVDFTNRGRMVSPKKAKPGDLILFTGTDTSVRRVGHMGIIVSNSDDHLQFIHSSSGKSKGVVITPLENYYKTRFVKIIRVFSEKSKETKESKKKSKKKSTR